MTSTGHRPAAGASTGPAAGAVAGSRRVPGRAGRYQQAADYLRLSLGLFRDARDRTGEAHALGNSVRSNCGRAGTRMPPDTCTRR